MLAPLAAVVLSLLPASHDPPRVLVLAEERAGPQDGFVAALRIQLAGVGRVEVGPPAQGDGLAARVSHAAGLVAAAGATLAVWIERGAPDPADAPHEFVLYLVGRDRSHALIEVFRLPAGDPAVIDRALALKVRDVLDQVLAREHAASAAGWLAAGHDQRPRPRRPCWLAEVGWSFAPALGAPGWQIGPRLGGGVRHRRRPVDLDLSAGIRLVDGFSAYSFAGSITTREVPLAVSLRATTGSRPAIGGEVEVGVRWIEAVGVTPFGARGRIIRWLPTTYLGVTGALPLRHGVELRTSLGVDLALHRLRLAVNQVEILDLGRAHPRADLGLALAWP
jgi:hypothetical protein